MRKIKGFTLVELMVVVAIIGILAGIAYPSYQDSVTKSRRVDAQGVLMGFANAMERHFTENNTYCGSAVATACPVVNGVPTVYSTQSPIDGATVYYNLIIQAANASTYNLRATPTGAQAGDGVLEINSTESKGRWDHDNDNSTAMISWK